MSRSRASIKRLGETCIRRVVAPDGGSLGWAVCALTQDSPNSQQADLLILRQCCHQWEAEIAERGFRDRLHTDRNLLAALADPSDFWEWNALPQLGSSEIYWTGLDRDELVAFQGGQYPIICERADWHPLQQDLVTEIIEGQPEFAHFANEIRRLLNEAVTDPDGSNLYHQ